MDTLMVKGIYRDGVIIPERPVTEWERKEVVVFFHKKGDFGLKPDRDYGKELKNIYPEIASNYYKVMEQIAKEESSAEG